MLHVDTCRSFSFLHTGCRYHFIRNSKTIFTRCCYKPRVNVLVTSVFCGGGIWYPMEHMLTYTQNTHQIQYNREKSHKWKWNLSPVHVTHTNFNTKCEMVLFIAVAGTGLCKSICRIIRWKYNLHRTWYLRCDCHNIKSTPIVPQVSVWRYEKDVKCVCNII